MRKRTLTPVFHHCPDIWHSVWHKLVPVFVEHTLLLTISQGNSLPDPDLACLSSSISNLTPAHTHTHTAMHFSVCTLMHTIHMCTHAHFGLNDANLVAIPQAPNF